MDLIKIGLVPLCKLPVYIYSCLFQSQIDIQVCRGLYGKIEFLSKPYNDFAVVVEDCHPAIAHLSGFQRFVICAAVSTFEDIAYIKINLLDVTGPYPLFYLIRIIR